MPSGMPTAPRTAASTSTVCLSWRLDAPSEESRPNCRVRSETEMVKALVIRLTAAATTTAASVAANMPSVLKMRRSGAGPRRSEGPR